MEKYILFADGLSPHTIKWAQALKDHFDLYLLCRSGFSGELSYLIGPDHIISCGPPMNFSGKNYDLLLGLPSICETISRLRPRFFNAHYLMSYGLMAVLAHTLARTDDRLITSTWGSDILVTPDRHPLLKRIAAYCLRKSHVVTSDSEFMTSRIRMIYDHPLILTFPFGVTSLPPVDQNGKDPYLMFSNRALSSNYNIKTIMEWFGRIHRENPSYRLVVAHNGEENNLLRSFAQRPGLEKAIKFVGTLSRKSQDEYYRAAKFYLSIPTSDSTSVSLLEAMSFGCVPIVSDIPANREWVQDGCNGIYFRPDLTATEIESIPLEKCFLLNRNIIARKAIWPKIIEDYVGKIRSL